MFVLTGSTVQHSGLQGCDAASLCARFLNFRQEIASKVKWAKKFERFRDCCCSGFGRSLYNNNNNNSSSSSSNSNNNNNKNNGAQVCRLSRRLLTSWWSSFEFIHVYHKACKHETRTPNAEQDACAEYTA